MSNEAKKIWKMILNILVPLTVICLICFLGPRLLRFFMPFVIGWLLAMIANPLVRFLESKVKILRKHSSVIIVVLVLAAIVGIFYLLISRLIMEASGLAKDLPGFYASMVADLRTMLARFQHVFNRFPPSIQNTLNQLSSNIGSYISLGLQKIASPTVTVAGNVAKKIPNALVYTIITILSSYMFIAERDKLLEMAGQYMPETVKEYTSFLKDNVKKMIGGYFMAQFKIMGIVGAVLFVGFLILGVSYNFLLAFLVAFLDLLPIFGTGTILIPWAVVRAFGGDYAFAAGLALLYVLTQLIRRIIEPKIIGDSFGVPPLLTLFLLYIGFKWSGIGGMILAVPLGMIVLNLYKYGSFDSMLKNMKLLWEEIDSFRRN